MNIVDRMEALAARFDGEVKAFHDPARAWPARPCLLVVPPALDWTEGTLDGTPQVTWTLVALSSYDAGTLEAVAELDVLVQAANAELDIERATLARYRINEKTPPAAAYLCTHTEIED